MRFERRVTLLLASLPFAVMAAGCMQQTPSQPPAAAAPAAAPSQTPAERGRVLVQVGGCNDCHTTKKLGPDGPEPDMSKELSGHPSDIKISAPYKAAAGSPWTIGTTDTLTAWSGGWGITFAANLTPDPNTGLKSGAWSEALFIQAMRTGKHIGNGRPILPPMPWAMYSKLSDDDLKAIWAYLMSIKPIENAVPDPITAPAPAAKK
jgi:cytochrome c553